MNRGYQEADIRVCDYQLWRLNGTSLYFRGPGPVEAGSKYFVALGAAQTFGRFVPRPYVSILHDHFAIHGVNLSVSGAGPSFFLRSPRILEIIENAEFVILQVMSGRSVENSEFEVGMNQGTLRRRNKESGFVFAEFAYKELLKESDVEKLVKIRAETQHRYIEEMVSLLQLIKCPTTLLWFSTRHPEYNENISDIGGYLGDFPHFISRSVIEQITPYADSYVEIVSKRGLPQPIFDFETKEPSLVWPEDLFPGVKLRYHNNYYPSPEMHEDVAAALLRLDLSKVSSRKKNSRRKNLLCHRHVFGNSGDFIDKVLKEAFGSRWICVDHKDLVNSSDIEDDGFLNKSELKAFSTHSHIVPRFDERLVFNLVLFLQHPILRLKKIYEIERSPSRQAFLNLPHTAKAGSLSFKDYVGWVFSSNEAVFPFSNYQTRLLSSRSSVEGTSVDPPDTCDLDLGRALQLIQQIRVVGICEEMTRSCAALDKWLRPVFPEVSFSTALLRTEAIRGNVVVDEEMAEIRDEIGEELFRRIIHANEMDLVLYDFAKSQLLGGQTGMPSASVS